MEIQNEKPTNISFLLFKVYFLTSLFTFSGGLAMIEVLREKLVDKHKLITKEDFYNYASLSQSLPGVITITNACFVGQRIKGTKGMFIAAIGAILPAFVFMLIATVLYHLVPQEGPIYSALTAIRAVSSVFILSAALSMAKYNLGTWLNKILALAAFVVMVFALLSALYFVAVVIMLSLLITFWKRGKKQ